MAPASVAAAAGDVAHDFGTTGTDAILVNADHWAFAGTSSRPGDRLSMMGGALSRRWFDGPARAYSTLAESAAGDGSGTRAAMAAYATPGGGLVFSAASAQWAWGLDDDGAPQTRPSARSEVVQQITRNVLTRFAQARSAERFPGPSGVTAAPGAGRIVLRWDSSPRRGVRYHVYRDTTDAVGADARRINAEPIEATTVIDADVLAGRRYFYVVVAVDADDWVSDPSAVVSAMALTSSTPLLAPNRLIAGTDGSGVVTLRWQHATPALVSGYRVYRRLEAQLASPWSAVNPTQLEPTMAFADVDTASIGARSYSIEAVGVDGRVSARSNPVTVAPFGTTSGDWLPLDIVATWHLAGAEASPEFIRETRDPFEPFPGWLFDGQRRYEIQDGESWNGLWSFPRFGMAAESLVSVRGQEIRLEANAVAGGVIAELWWQGRQFLNGWSFGRMLQMTLFLDPEGNANPTEGGDYYSAPGPVDLRRVPAGWTHGSPLIDLSTSDAAVSTVTAPLNWVTERTPGRAGNLAHPMLWGARSAKNCS